MKVSNLSFKAYVEYTMPQWAISFDTRDVSVSKHQENEIKVLSRQGMNIEECYVPNDENENVSESELFFPNIATRDYVYDIIKGDKTNKGINIDYDYEKVFVRVGGESKKLDITG